MQIDDILLLRMNRQYLFVPAEDELTVLRGLCGLQAQFYGNCLHALRLRCGKAPDEDILRTSAAKTWTLRGTLHLIALDDLPLFLYDGRSHFLRPCDTMENDDHLSAARKRSLRSDAGVYPGRCRLIVEVLAVALVLQRKVICLLLVLRSDLCPCRLVIALALVVGGFKLFLARLALRVVYLVYSVSAGSVVAAAEQPLIALCSARCPGASSRGCGSRGRGRCSRRGCR